MARQVLGDVIQARAEEICQLVLTEIRRAGFDRNLNSGVVLTGGGAILEGMPEIAEQIFDMPVRRGTPAGIGGLVDVVASPVYSTAVGLVLCGLSQPRGPRARAPRGRRRRGPSARSPGASWVGCRTSSDGGDAWR